MMPREFPPTVLGRRAVVYVRQSSGAQVHENLESQRRQYALRDVARGYGLPGRPLSSLCKALHMRTV